MQSERDRIRRQIISDAMYPFTAAERTAPPAPRPTNTGTEGMPYEYKTMEGFQDYLRAYPETIHVEGDPHYPHTNEIMEQPVYEQRGSESQSRGDRDHDLVEDISLDPLYWADPRTRRKVIIAIIGENNLPKLLYEYSINGRAWTSDPSSYTLRRARIAESAVLFDNRVRDPWPELNPFAPEAGVLSRIRFLEDEGYITRKSLQEIENLQAARILWGLLVLMVTIWILLQVLRVVWSYCLGDGEDEWEERGSVDGVSNLRKKKHKRTKLKTGKEHENQRLSTQEKSELRADTLPQNEEESELRVDTLPQNEEESEIPKAAFASSSFHGISDKARGSTARIRQSRHRGGSTPMNDGEVYEDKYEKHSTGRHSTHARSESVAEFGTQFPSEFTYETPHGNLRRPTQRQPRYSQHDPRYGEPLQTKSENSNTILDDCFNTTDVEEDLTYEPSDEGSKYSDDESVAGDSLPMQEDQPRAPTLETDQVQSSTRKRGRSSRRAPTLNGPISSPRVNTPNKRGSGSRNRYR